MEGGGGDVEMDCIKNRPEDDRRSVLVENVDYACPLEAEAVLNDSELRGRRLTVTANSTAATKTNGVSPLMPTRYDWPPVPTSQGFHIQEAERLRREVEKRRIKEDIISAGVAWRRALEAEVLRDLQMEGFGFPGFEHSQVPQTDEEKLIALAKLDPGHCGVKRKVENLLEVPSLPCPGVKKLKEELSCALCHESSIGEKDLNSHLQSRKHQAKVAALKAELAAKCCSTPPLANKPANPSKVAPPAIRMKRKAETLSGVPSLRCPCVKKKSEEECSCALYHVETDLQAELAAKCCSNPPVANKPANPSKLRFVAAGSEVNADIKDTPPAIGASYFGPDAKVEVGEDEGSKTDEPELQYCKSPPQEKKFKNWYEMWKDMKVVCQQNQSEEIVANIPIQRLSADDEKEDATSIEKAGGSMLQDMITKQVHDVLGNGKEETVAPKAIAAELFGKAHSKDFEEAYANLAQLALKSNMKKDDIAIEKADDSMVCNAKTGAFQDDQANEKMEGAALKVFAEEVARRENFRKLFRKADTELNSKPS